MAFNKAGRTTNAVKVAAVGITNQIVNMVCGFVFRTVFLMVLSKEYLGLNGLFTNVLSVLSLAELGISTAIIYKMYVPIAQNDEIKVAQMMHFYKNIYRIIAAVVTVIGLALLPAIKFLIKDAAEIPSDVNIYVVYCLFLAQSVTSYLFVYKSSILIADQKSYINSACSIGGNILNTALRIVVLFVTKNFVATLITGIVVALVVNIINSIIATKMYPAVFKKGSKLDKFTQKQIMKDTYAMACHKIGGVIVGSTDSILLSAFIGIGILGLYSNYSMLLFAVAGLIGQLLSSFQPSIGNANLKLSNEDFFKTYKRLQFINLVIISCVCISFYCLLEPFITIWLGADMLLESNVTVVLVVAYFFSHCRHINLSFISATGLFRKDKLRPLIESLVNLVASILFVRFLGVIGIFLGTIVSQVLVVFWREPYLLFKYRFNNTKKLLGYFATTLCFGVFTFCVAFGLNNLLKLMPSTIGFFVLKVLICGFVPISLLLFSTCLSDECDFTLTMMKKFFRKFVNIFHRKGAN